MLELETLQQATGRLAALGPIEEDSPEGELLGSIGTYSEMAREAVQWIIYNAQDPQSVRDQMYSGPDDEGDDVAELLWNVKNEYSFDLEASSGIAPSCAGLIINFP